MDYDRYDATLHYIFKQTQGDAWFRPHEDQVPPGVCLRTHDGQFRVFPYENAALAPFEAAVSALNPLVAVKVRSAAVHAALAEQAIDDCIYVDANTRIQVLDSMVLLPQAEKDQNAAFIRDERVLVVWSDSLDTIIPIARDFEDRLIRLLWRSRPPLPSELSLYSHSEKPEPQLTPSSTVNSESLKRTWYGRVVPSDHDPEKPQKSTKRPIMLYSPIYNGLSAALAFVFIGNGLRTLLIEFRLDGNYTHFALCALMPLLFCVSLFFTLQIIQSVSFAIGPIAHYHQNSRYYSAIRPAPNPAVDNALPHITIQMPVYKESLATVLTPSLISLKTAMQTYARHGGTSSLFINDDGLRLLPPDQAKERIEYYATHGIGWIARPKHGHQGFIRAGRFKKASNMNYALDISLRLERILEELQSPTTPHHSLSLSHSQHTSFALNNASRDSNIFTPPNPPFHRASVSTTFSAQSAATGGTGTDGGSMLSVPGQSPGTYGLQYIGKDGDEQGFVPPFVVGPNGGGSLPGTPRPSAPVLGTPRTSTPPMPPTTPPTPPMPHEQPTLASTPIEDLEERALQLAMEEVYHTSGTNHRPWAANARACRIGSIILLVDADTVVPADCFRDAAREFGEDEGAEVGVLQHESDVLQVANHYFENAIAFFTRRINKCISMMCANGEVAPFVGHNAFLRWSALQDAVFVDGDVHFDDPGSGSDHRTGGGTSTGVGPREGGNRKGKAPAHAQARGTQMKIWSEDNVSEDFDMALRLLRQGYIVRWATYSLGGFKEGVSLTVDDELNRWQKYAYGCNELLFNPLVKWFYKGPVSSQIHKFLWSPAPLHYKISMMAYMFSYYGIAASVTISVINYIMLGFQFPTDDFYMHSFEIWLATFVVFFGAGSVGYVLLQYRLGEKGIIGGAIECFGWMPFFFFFFGGLGIPLSQAILAHMFSYNITWSATKKEVERSNFFKEVPRIFKRCVFFCFWFRRFGCLSLRCASAHSSYWRP
ncbi:glycosyl transferase family group 2-domain-containing protein [Suillus paluster]|uniref:glycosyl transferase family group 2-domain-containing protein n=1 Tax=Suillus paluster TaxID=48578 RepID=UPI001B86D7EF|nr:glycosyl transferase family group 2-domain-containing protein [Suillus paluster]KAG1733862.1 glycosyl transferase family group 2-domain-containing protein [Suillus paluster]